VTGLEALGILAAGFAAGTINTVVGSGSLITFPALLAFGYSPLVANVSNTVGLFPGSISGAIGYRQELSGQRRRIVELGLASIAGGVVGAMLLLLLPASAFRSVVPALIALACVLVAVQPWLARLVARHLPVGETVGWPLIVLVFLTAVYGGYFGAAQGVLLMGLFGILLRDHIQRLNALKNVCAALVNGVAAIVFTCIAPVAWTVVGLVALGAVAGGQVGARLGRRLPPMLLRIVIIAVGLVATMRLLLG
jgi:uncharacterized membrane protein YfcA